MFGWFKKKKDPETVIQQKEGVFLTTRGRSDKEEKIRTLNLNATSLADKGDFDSAIKCLREAATLMPKVNTIYPVSRHMRLPLFLQRAGRMNEAMTEANLLLGSFSDLRERSVVLDKIRLMYEREKDFKTAIVFRIRSETTDYLARVKYDLGYEHIDAYSMTESFQKLLKKTKMETHESRLIKVFKKFIKEPTPESAKRAEKEIIKILGI